MKNAILATMCVAALSLTTSAFAQNSTGPAPQSDNMSNGGMDKGGMSKDGMSKEGMSKKGMSKDNMAKEGMSKDGMSKEGMKKGQHEVMENVVEAAQ